MSRLARQSFLGPDSERRLCEATIGVVGLGGGGSHVVQQVAHVGIGGHIPVDFDHITGTNTNRLVGGTLDDVDRRLAKIAIAERVIRGLQPRARVFPVRDSWHKATDHLKRCDVIVGAVDSFKEREQLERFARRYLIPYIDVGMDVHDLGKNGFLVAGQVILSTPGAPCLRCCGLVTDDRLAREAEDYGAAGERPQVVWPNGVLASTAVGLAVQLITPWFPCPPVFTYLEYDGNRGTVSVSVQVEVLKGRVCPHHPPDETGDPLFDIRAHLRLLEQRRQEDRSSRQSPAPKAWWRKLLHHCFG
jgi:hypothetical protein